jgi:hypothetical protein
MAIHTASPRRPLSNTLRQNPRVLLGLPVRRFRTRQGNERQRNGKNRAFGFIPLPFIPLPILPLGLASNSIKKAKIQKTFPMFLTSRHLNGNPCKKARNSA